MKQISGIVKTQLEKQVKYYMKKIFVSGPQSVKVELQLDSIDIICCGILNRYEKTLVQVLDLGDQVRLIRRQLVAETSHEFCNSIDEILSNPIHKLEFTIDIEENRCQFKVSI